MACKNSEWSDHEESEDLSPGRIWQKHKKEDKGASQDQSGFDFVKHGDGKKEEIAKEKEG